MADSRVKVHENALVEIKRRKAEIKDELELIEKAESYHSSSLRQLGVLFTETPAGSSNGSQRRDSETASNAVPAHLSSMTKHDAAVVALRAMGGQSTVPGIVDWLRERNYGRHLERKMLINGMRTALVRKPETFEPLGDGLWRWREWADKPADNA